MIFIINRFSKKIKEFNFEKIDVTIHPFYVIFNPLQQTNHVRGTNSKSNINPIVSRFFGFVLLL